MGVVVFILLWIIFQVLALRQRRKKAEQARIDDAKNIAEQLEFCRDCSLKKINNGMGFRKIYLASEIKQIESKLDQDVDPSKASVLVYTSDLSTILRRLDVIKANINKKINYRIVYFKLVMMFSVFHYLLAIIIFWRSFLFADNFKIILS